MYLAEKYAYIGKTFLMAILYIQLMPIGVIISFLGLSFFYIVEKYMVLNVYKKPPNIDALISFAYLENFRIFMMLNFCELLYL